MTTFATNMPLTQDHIFISLSNGYTEDRLGRLRQYNNHVGNNYKIDINVSNKKCPLVAFKILKILIHFLKGYCCATYRLITFDPKKEAKIF
jgi:hypothetical protein